MGLGHRGRHPRDDGAAGRVRRGGLVLAGRPRPRAAHRPDGPRAGRRAADIGVPGAPGRPRRRARGSCRWPTSPCGPRSASTKAGSSSRSTSSTGARRPTCSRSGSRASRRRGRRPRSPRRWLRPTRSSSARRTRSCRSDPILAVPGMREAIAAARARGVPVVAVSPIIGGRALKGPADRMLASLGHEATALGVARLYADLADVFVLDTVDAALAGDVEAPWGPRGRRRHDHDRRRLARPTRGDRARRGRRALRCRGRADGEAREGALERWACATRSGSSRTSSRA